MGWTLLSAAFDVEVGVIETQNQIKPKSGGQECPPYTRRSHTQCPEGTTVTRDYDGKVRYYTTKSMNGGTTFKCSLCEHSVTTLNFNSTVGNRRTQAATAMNQHAAASHMPFLPPGTPKIGGRRAL